MHTLFSLTVIEVSWIISEPIEVTEAEREEGRDGELILLELFAQAFGLYATPIKIGVVCAEVITTGVPPGADTISSTDTPEHAIIYHSSPLCNYLPLLIAAIPDRDFVVLSGSTLEFTDVETLTSNSSNNLTLLIIDDDITEPCESFICTLQGGAVDRVRGVEPNRVIVRICDDDGEHKQVCTVHIV